MIIPDIQSFIQTERDRCQRGRRWDSPDFATSNSPTFGGSLDLTSSGSGSVELTDIFASELTCPREGLMVLWQSSETGIIGAGEVHEIGPGDEFEVFEYTQTNLVAGNNLELWVLSWRSSDLQADGDVKSSRLSRFRTRVTTTQLKLSEVVILASNFSLDSTGRLPGFVVHFANDRKQQVALV
eukprot:FR736503.1.p1 GENE.FR736503.1~~FR736503.1.p1  ORF type:complete len:197 (+),score=17.14 FR736503.1:43-591(+)